MLKKDADKKTEAEKFQQKNDQANRDRQEATARNSRFAERDKQQVKPPVEKAESPIGKEPSEATFPEKSGLEHTWETNLAEGGTLDQLTEQIGKGIVEKLSGSGEKSKEAEPDKSPGKSDWDSLVKEFSPESARDKDKTQEKEVEPTKDDR